jgi:hypothetical protein
MITGCGNVDDTEVKLPALRKQTSRVKQVSSEAIAFVRQHRTFLTLVQTGFVSEIYKFEIPSNCFT